MAMMSFISSLISMFASESVTARERPSKVNAIKIGANFLSWIYLSEKYRYIVIYLKLSVFEQFICE